MHDIQMKSTIYDSNPIAPPLKPLKTAPKKTLGKGWFDLEVLIFILFYFFYYEHYI